MASLTLVVTDLLRYRLTLDRFDAGFPFHLYHISFLRNVSSFLRLLTLPKPYATLSSKPFCFLTALSSEISITRRQPTSLSRLATSRLCATSEASSESRVLGYRRNSFPKPEPFAAPAFSFPFSFLPPFLCFVFQLSSPSLASYSAFMSQDSSDTGVILATHLRNQKQIEEGKNNLKVGSSSSTLHASYQLQIFADIVASA